MPITFPNQTSRTSINGSTGSGKSQLGLWLLASRDWHKRPCFIFDWKRDKLIAQIVEAANAKEISIRAKPPTKPGLYVIRPMPDIDDDAVTQFFWNIWRNEDTIVYIDEGYMVPNNSPAFRALLTQGRSKNIEMITLTQRPVKVDRFVFSEAEFFVMMRLNDARDRKTLAEMTGVSVNYKLPPYHWIWYDGASDQETLMAPVPDRDTIISLFRKPRRKAKAL